MVVASAYTDVLKGFGGNFSYQEGLQWNLSIVEHSTRVREGYAKPSSSIPYGNIRKSTDLKWEDRKLAK